MALTFFKARDVLDQQILSDPQVGSGNELALFRFLLEHVWWSGEHIGWVTEAWTGHGQIAKAMGVSPSTVQKALGVLVAEGLASKHPRYGGRGVGRLNDAIYLDWLNQFTT
jgi:DNA-binding transcriptional ArsR family regulator